MTDVTRSENAGDIVKADLLRKNRSALLEEIQKAKGYFTRLAR